MIPTEEMELIHSEFGTVLISVLWDKTGDGTKRMVAFPALKFNGSTYEAWHAYWMESGGGGISA